MMRTCRKRGVFILFLMIFLSLFIFHNGYVFGQDIVDLGLAGQWSNAYGRVYAIKVLDSEKISNNGEKGEYYAFCATSKGIVVFSIHKDNNLKRESVRVSVKSFITIGICRDIAIWKDDDNNNIFAYLAGGEKGLHIIKIVHPESLYYIANIDTPCYAKGVTISQDGKFAFVADGESGLQVINISNPNGPFIAVSCDTPESAEGVAVSQDGKFAFVADGESGLQVIDISNPNGPFITGSCDTPYYAYEVAIAQDGQVAYVADWYSGLLVINISNRNSPFITGWCYTSGYARGVTLSDDGHYAFVADWYSGLQVIDISDPISPFIAGSCYTPGYARGVALSDDGDYAFVADGDSGLQVINISSDPNGPHIAGNCDTPGWAKKVILSQDGQVAFVADGDNGLQVIDISDPIGPFIAGSCDTPDWASGVALSQNANFAFVADGDSGLQAIDISDPNRPFIAGSCDTPGSARGVALSDDGHYAFVADWDSGLQIIDISDPNRPFIDGNCDTPGDASGVALSKDGKFAFVADWDSGLQIIDIRDSNRPFIDGSCDTPGDASGVALSKDGKFAFVADRVSGLLVIDISNPVGPFIAGWCYTTSLAYEVALAQDGKFAFVTERKMGLEIIDISDPISPFIVGWCDTHDYAEGVTLAQDGKFAFVADGRNGLQIIYISDPVSPFIAGRCETSGSAEGVAFSQDGKFAFVANGKGGLRIIDISGPSGPFIVGWCDTPYAKGVALAQDSKFAFVADQHVGLLVIDISDPNNPFIGGWCDTPDEALGITLSQNGQFAFVADRVSGLLVIDISNPNRPFIVSSCDTPSWAQGVALSEGGQFAYMADGYMGLQIIDISDPNNPFIVGGCDTPGDSNGVALSEGGQFAYMADGYMGLQIIDISDPNNPFIVGSCDTPDYAQGVALSEEGKFAFVADWDSGLQIIDISDPNVPFIAGCCYTPGSARGIVLSKNRHYAFVADGEGGLLQIKINYTPSPKGNLILVAGGDINYKTPYWHATQALANKVYHTFITRDYGSYDIYYFNPSFIQDINQDGTPDQLAIDDFDPNATDLKNIIEQFPDDHMTNNQGPLYISLMGHGSEDRFQLKPNEVVTSHELKESIRIFQNDTNRPVVVILESAASGSFIDDLADLNAPYQNTTIITSTGRGPSYIKPSPDPNNPVPISFTSLLMAEIENYSLENLSLLKEAFIDAREKVYNTNSLPFLDQAPQMYIPGGPIDISFIQEDPNRLYDSNNPEAPFIITQEDPITLIPKVYYPDGSIITLDPHRLIFLSSRPQVFNPSDPNQLEIDPDNTNHILIHPARARNGLCTLIAYPDPDYYPDILLTVRLPIEVSIPGNTIAGGNKALIVAGYRTEGGIPDYLWKSTNTIANHAYLSLRKKRYSHDDIFYLTPLHKQDVDRNGKYDDIDGYPNIEKIDWAVNQIKQTGAEDLLIFLIDHGHQETFSLNPAGEELTAQYLKERITALAPSSKEEKHIQKNITLLIEACHSGSFIPALENNLQPQADPNRIIIITSADPNETAQFLADGLISFSYPFFDEYLLTNSIFNAYRHACRFIPPIGQTPQISDPDIARKRDKALEYYIDEAQPVITERGLSREGEKLMITAQVYSLSGIDRVWVIITTCEESPPAPEGGPRTEDPIDLIPDDPNAPYGSVYSIQMDDPYPDAFNYQVILSAKDKTGKVVTERTNINNQEKNTTGAIILVTDLYTMAPSISQAIHEQSHRTYRILKEKQIEDPDIYYVKTLLDYLGVDYLGEKIDNKIPASFDMEEISTWLQDKTYQMLLIYLIGESHEGNSFKLDQTRSLSPWDISSFVDPNGCQVLLFCEMTDARSFLNHLPLKPNWTGIASPYIKIDTPLFSNHFFSRLYCFDTVGEAFEKAYRAFKAPLIPSNYIYFHDFVPTSFGKIRERLAYYLGNPKIEGEDPMLIRDTQILEETSTITLHLRVNESARIKTPWAELRTPSGSISRIFLEQRDANASLWGSPPLPKDKPYTRVSFYVEQIQDANQPGIIDWRERAITSFSQVTGKRSYEPNDTQEYAYPIVIDISQRHTFHDTNDADWVYFYAYNEEVYYIEAYDSVYGYFTKITLCDANGIMIHQEGFYNPFYIDQFWQCNQNGYYTLRVESAAAPEDIPFSYDLSIIKAPAPIPAADIQGRVVDQNDEGINGLDVYVQTDKGTWKKTSTGSIKNVRRPAAYPTTIPPKKTEGWYFMENLPAPGSYRIRVTAKDEPNTILAELGSTYLYENNIHWIDDIIIVQDLLPSQKDPNKEVVEGFERAYNRWQQTLGRQYLPWEDTDNDGFTNLEEFLNGTDPSDPDHPSLAYSLYPGLNLFPFYLTDPYWASDFCSERLEEYHSIWGYNNEENVWDYWYNDSAGTDFPLEKGKGYLIYKHTPEVVYQEAHNSITFLSPGINVIDISPIPEGGPYRSYTSFQFLRDRKKEGVKSISRYRNDQEGEYKLKGISETAYLFFGRPAGVEFPILPNEAYLIKIKR